MIYTKPRGISNDLHKTKRYIKWPTDNSNLYQKIYTKAEGISNDLHKN